MVLSGTTPVDDRQCRSRASPPTGRERAGAGPSPLVRSTRVGVGRPGGWRLGTAGTRRNPVRECTSGGNGSSSVSKPFGTEASGYTLRASVDDRSHDATIGDGHDRGRVQATTGRSRRRSAPPRRRYHGVLAVWGSTGVLLRGQLRSRRSGGGLRRSRHGSNSPVTPSRCGREPSHRLPVLLDRERACVRFCDGMSFPRWVSCAEYRTRLQQARRSSQ